MHVSIGFLAAIATQAIATPIARSPYAVKETHYVPRDWSKLERSHGGKTIQLQIGLKQGSFDELDRHLHESTYNNNFGTMQEV
jgi:tripeptidyl-peptidase-1